MKTAADKFFEETDSFHNCQIPRPQPIDFVLDFFNHEKGLFFVDVGSYNGVTWSNSYALEKYLDWNGICVEANPDAFKELEETRSCEKVNCCVSSSELDIIFRKVSGYAEMLSGILSLFDSDHINRIDKETEAHGGSYEDIVLKSRKLSDICKKTKRVDYLSVDCEGGEYDVLNSLDWKSIKPTLISVESNEIPRESDIKARDLLTDKGYKKEVKICGDMFYSLK